MRYHHTKPKIYISTHGQTHTCNHPVYTRCTLYLIDNKGLAVIQQRFDSDTKTTWWGELDPWLTDELYLHPSFTDVFTKRGGMSTDDIYPTITVRQLMWALKMKPLSKARWETVFDRSRI